MEKVPESQENARVALTISWSSRFTVLGGQEQKKIRSGTVAFSGYYVRTLDRANVSCVHTQDNSV